MASEKQKFARPSDGMVAQLKDMIQKYGPKAKVYDPDALEAARAAVKEPQNYGADEYRMIMADLKAAAGQKFSVEDNFYFKGKKAKMARNPEFDTDEVKNILHKESRDAEWGIDREVKGRGLHTYSAYHAYIGEPVVTKRFNTRGEAEKWLEKQNSAGHPNKRKLSRPGEKEKFAANKSKILAELKDLLAMLKQVKADRGDIAEVTDAIKFVEKSNSSNEIGQVYRNAMDIEGQYFSRSGEKAKFQLPSADAYKQKELLRTATVHANNLTHQLFGLGQTIKSTGEQAQRMSQHYQTLIQDAQTPKEMAMVAAEIVKYAGKMARDLSASLREPIK